MDAMTAVRSLFAAMCAIPCVLGLAWAGCATAESVDGSPTKPLRDSGTGGDSASGDAGDGGGGGDSGDGGVLCGETSTPNACATAIDLGTVNLGGKNTASGGVPVSGGDVWYKITFDGLADLAAHPKIVLTSDDEALAFEVVRSCAGERIMCAGGDEATKIKEFEVAYRPTTGDDAGPGPDPDASGDAITEAGTPAGVFVPITVGDKGTVYVRVYRSTGVPKACDFDLDVSN